MFILWSFAKRYVFFSCVGMCLKCVGCTIHAVLTQPEKLLLANREKDKGNEAFRANDYEEAVAYYSRSGSSNNPFIIENVLNLLRGLYYVAQHLIRLLSFID